jgi:hypothetical protein
MSKLFYGAKSREEARLAERVINAFHRDIDEAIELAKTCPCMEWLVRIIIPDSSIDGYDALMLSGSYYAYGLAMNTVYNINSIPRKITKRAAKNGCPISQCIMYRKTERTFWAQMAADQGYSKGFYLLGKYREAAELGNGAAMWKYGCDCEDDQEAYYWIGKAFLMGYGVTIDARNVSWAANCQLGAIRPNFREFYISHCETVKKTIHAWSLVARRLGVVKDMRVYIAKIVWSGRVYRAEECEKLYKGSCQN